MKTWHSIIPAADRKWLRAHPQTQVSQCLTDLGYWVPGVQEDLKKALIAFRKEAKAAHLLSAKAAANTSKRASLAEEQLLKNLLALEGDFPLQQIPAQQSLSLPVRLLHYRLHLLSLYPRDQIHQPFSPASLQALQQLGEWLQIPPDSPALLLLTGDLNALIHQIHQQGRLDQQIVAFQFSADQLPPDLQKEVKEERGVKESEKTSPKAEQACDRELQKLTTQILDQEKAERKRLLDRNQNKQKRLQQISLLIRSLNAQQRKRFSQRMKERAALEKKIKRQEKDIQQKQDLLQSMEQELEELKNADLSAAQKRTKRNKLKEQIKGRKALLKTAKKTANQLQQSLTKLVKKQAKEQAKSQQKFLALRARLKALRIKVNGLRFRFKGQLKQSLQTSAYRKLVKNVFSAKDQDYLKERCKNKYNLFLIRIIQLHQWTNGYYHGCLDSKFAGKTFGAIVEMTEDIPRLRLKYILTSLRGKKQGYWILNIAYLIERFCHLHPLATPAPDEQEILQAYLAAHHSQQNTLYNKNTQELWQDYQKQQTEPDDDALPRRAYFGRSSLLRSFGRVIKKIGQIIFQGLKATWQILQNFVRMLYEDLRSSVVLFAQSLDFLFGKRRTLPLGEGENWDTPKYVYDDLLSVEENAAAAENHFTEAAQISNLPTKSIQNTLKILARVAKFAIALATGGITWPALLTQLILFCRRWFLRWLKNTLLHRRRELFALPA